MGETNPKQVVETIQKEVLNEIEKKKKGEYTTVDYGGADRILKRLNTTPRFIMELIQNADDNAYDTSREPWIKFYLREYQKEGYSYCLHVVNNEKGFRRENVEKLCQFFGSTKRRLGFIGEFGVGFKSVFSITKDPYIYSNGFSFKLHYEEKEPLTLIMPIWVEKPPKFVEKGCTNIVLPFVKEREREILNQLKGISPSLLLFLKKLRKIEIINQLTSENKSFKRIERGDKFLILEDKGNEQMWEVVRKEMKIPWNLKEYLKRQIGKDAGIDITEVILAFPLKEDGSPDASREQYVFAFLPVRKYGFRFIIQADFILSANREDIIKDNEWNEWLRDSIVKVFLDAVNEFKEDEKLRYSFYNYLPLDNEIKDEFFLPVVKQIYERLRGERCVLTEAGKWRRPSEVLVGDEGIRKIVTNEDLQKFLRKEYLSEKIKAKKPILHKLGVRDFSIDDLIRILGNTEWLKKQSDEWFARLYRYLSNKKLSEEQLERLKNLDIIKLENEELTSVNEGVVFFPLEEKVVYGFENELRVIKKDIIDAVLKHEKEERDKILEFLKKLGLKQADSYEIIENHILPIYEGEGWKQKDSRTLRGYIRYIKDNTDKYKRESDGRLNANKASGETKKDSLERLKKSLLIRTDRDTYEHPENTYLPKTYGNENDLEELFEEIDVSFVNSCYLEQDIRQINDEIAELKNKLKDKSKTWKKIEKKIKDLEEKRKKKIREWKEFFLKLGVHEVPKVEYYYGSCGLSYSHTYCDFQSRVGIPEGKMKYSTKGHRVRDWKLSQEFEYVLENGDTERIKILLTILDKYWKAKYSKYLKMDYQWFYYCEEHKSLPSSFIRELKEKIRLPTTQNTLAKPSGVFLDKPEIRELLGDTVPYLAVKIKNEEFIEALGINTRANVRGVLNYLKALVEQKSDDKEKFEKLYNFLDEHFEEDVLKIKEGFTKNSLIFVPNTEKRYYTAKEVIWKDVSNIFGKNRIYLEKHYPKRFKKFFVEKLGISEKPTPKDYADVLIDISKKDEISEEDKKIVVKIYEELNRNLNPDRVENPISQEDWWNDFIKEAIFLTDRGEFRRNLGDIFINDDNELYELFRDEEGIRFLCLPDKYNPNRIRHFIEACNLRYIFKSIKVEPLLEESKYSKDQELTNRIRNLISYVLRYLYWRENATYEKLKKEEVFKKIGAIEVYVTEILKVRYSVDISEGEPISIDTNKGKPIERKCIYYDGNLYIKRNKRNNAGLNDLAVEFSKVFGEVKGLDSFLLLIINTPTSEIEGIMEIQKIGKLPEDEAEFLRNVSKTEKVEEKKEELSSEKEPEKTLSKEEEDEESEETPLSIPTKTISKLLTEPKGGASIIESNKDIPDETGEKEWTPQFSSEEVPVRIEEYKVQQNQLKEEEKEHDKKSSMEEIRILSPIGTTASPAENLSRKTREEIGRWGEEYALRCIKEALVERYSAASLVDTGQGFRLERNGSVIVEVIWENKNGESGKPYDIKIIENGDETFVEVKSTSSATGGTFQLSENEWSFMKEKGDRYYIYRVYGAGSRSPKARKIQNPMKLIQKGELKVKNATIEI